MATTAASPALSKIQKAAILMVSIGEQASAEVMKRLGEDEVKALSKAIARLETVPAEQAHAVMEEFYQAARSMTGAGRGGFEFATKVLTYAFGSEGAKKIAEELPKTSQQARKLEALQKADPDQLSRFIEREHPQTIALILAHLMPAQASSLLAGLPEELRADVAVRLAELDRVSPDVVHRISVVVSERLSSVGEMKSECYGGPRAIAEILNRMDGAVSEAILEGIQDRQPLVDAIRHYMFVFDDLLLIDSRAMKEVVARIDRKLLTTALKGTSDELKKHFLQCMSGRAADMLREDMEALGPVRIKEVEAAQQEILAAVRVMESEGVLSLKGGAGGQEEYVV